MRDVNTNKDDFKSILHTFNLITNEWNIPKTNGIEPIRRRQMSGVFNNETGKFYIFGGSTSQLTGSQDVLYFNVTEIFDTITLTWSRGSTLNAPFSRSDYT